MHFADWGLLASGGVMLTGIAYPSLAGARPGWKVGARTGGTLWSAWFGLGALAYLAGMATEFGWVGLLAALPLAFAAGPVLIFTAGARTQVIALTGPVLANLWYLM